MTFLISLLVIGAGLLLVLKTGWFYDFTGPIDFAEKVGGTHQFLKILGVLMILGAFLAMTGLLQSMIRGLFKMFGLTA